MFIKIKNNKNVLKSQSQLLVILTNDLKSHYVSIIKVKELQKLNINTNLNINLTVYKQLYIIFT